MRSLVEIRSDCVLTLAPAFLAPAQTPPQPLSLCAVRPKTVDLLNYENKN